jgi:ParB family chromosome partitioning protein
MCASHVDAELRPQLRDLPVASIRANERNPRLVFPQDELDRLAESIDLEGILVPLTVFPKQDHYVLVDGERRFRCATTLGLATVPALIVDEKPETDVLIQMFNIHLIREPWKDMPTAKALSRLISDLAARGEDASDTVLRDLTGLSVERVRQLRYILTLPEEWQDYIRDNVIPMNFFWELKRNVIDALARQRPTLLGELGGISAVAGAFVEKRLDGVITDTVALRRVRPIINFAAEDAGDAASPSVLDDTIRDLVTKPELTIDEAYEDTVQIMVEADKLVRRTRSMVASFERLLARARTDDERAQITEIARNLIVDLNRVLRAR